ncbi:MAG: helix-turn-helix domain-containing protein [Clostridia bacterium]|nr:helix-turn-helix domain-containing protein [Clostridia bacterium]
MDKLAFLSPYVRYAKAGPFHKSRTKYLSIEHSNFLLFVTEGSYVHTVNGQRITMSPGMLLLIPPFTNQVLGGCLTPTVSIALIDFDLFDSEEGRTIPHLVVPEYRRVREQELLLANYPTLVRVDPESWMHHLRCFDYIYANYSSKDLATSLHVKSSMLEILSIFLAGTPLNDACPKSTASHYIAEIVRYVDLNYKDTTLSVGGIADHLDLSLSYLSRLAAHELGCTLSEYITSVRLRKAKDLFALGNRVSDVAAECGFLSLQSFSRTFRRVEGISPRAYLNSPDRQKNADSVGEN